MIFCGGGGGGTASYELLWENANPSSSFTSQGISVSNLSVWDMVLIEGTHGATIVSTGNPGSQSLLQHDDDNGMTIYGRSVKISYDVISFSDCKSGSIKTNSSSHGTANSACVPVYIYGFKKQ